ncbi:MAG: diguanylate cyclase (GGDEF)-like protein [Oceanicoccus sp.]|jgi:diguanylate cyclase (GGDEF)-like protein
MNAKIGFTLSILTCFLLFSSFVFATDKVELQLRWYNQFQFAGYYMAAEKGFYKDQDIEVNIKPGGKGALNSIESIIQKKAHFSVSNSSAIINYMQGDPIVALAAISQNSPLVWITLKSNNIRIAQDLPGRTIMTLPAPSNTELFALLKQESIPLESVNIQPTSFDIEDLISGKVDAYNGYISNEPYLLKQRNIDFHLIQPRDYGINFYNDVLITHKEVAEHDPDLVKRFTQASLKGWKYALENIAESVDIISKKYAPNKSHDHLLYEANLIRESILPDLVQIGHMNPGRWQHIADTYKEFNMVTGNRNINEFIFNYKPKVNYFLIFVTTSTLIVIIFIFSIAIYHFRKLSLALRRSNQELASLAISDPLTGIMNRRGFIDNAERLISLESRQKKQICLMILDIDFFKKINDQFGHQVGDFCLIEFTQIVQSCCRMHDLVARIGGEEFIILLGDCTINQAREKASYIVQRVRNHTFKPSGINDTIKVTVSIGLAEVNSVLTAAWQQADEALYAVKNSGRNGVQIYMPST